MDNFKTPEQVQAAIKERMNASYTQRSALALSTSTSQCYYEGIQWLQQFDTGYIQTTAGRLPVNTNPDTGKLRVVWNEITTRTVKAFSATFPSDMDVEIPPPLMDSGVEASRYSMVMQNLLAAWVKKSGFLAAARACNELRSICGTYGLVLQMKIGNRVVGMDGKNVPMEDRRLEVYPFHPLRIVVDSAIQHRDLRQHEYVIYHDAWSAYAIRQAFPSIADQIDESEMKTLGSLVPYEVEINRLSGGRLFSRYTNYSSTKGARVYQYHAKDDRGVWSIMYSAVELGPNKWIVPNMDNPVSPFGGDQLPLVLIHGHPRSDSMWGISDVAMSKDAQDILNLCWSQQLRIAQKYGGANWLVDKRWMGPKTNDSDVRDQFTNKAHNIILGNPLSTDRNAQPPRLEATPAPSPFILEMADRASQRLLSSTFRSEVDSGEGLKSHTSDKLVSRYQANSGQVLGIRVEQDRVAYAQILTVALGTNILNTQAQSASTLAMLNEEGFQEDDIAAILQANPYYPTCGLEVSESSIHYRTTDEKKETLLSLLNSPNPIVSGAGFRKAMAEWDIAVVPDDKQFEQDLTRAVSELLRTGQWRPVMLGSDYNEWCLSILRRAQFDQRSKRDPAIFQAVVQAIQLQEQMGVQEQINTNPELVAQKEMQSQQLASQEQQAQMQAQQPQQQDQGQPPSNISEVLDQLAKTG